MFPALFKRKVSVVSIMGGLKQRAAAGSAAGSAQDRCGWEADTAANNMFNPDAAETVYRFCFDEGVRMHVVARDAVPHLPMALAKEFAARPGTKQALGLEPSPSSSPNPVMTYL